MLVAGWQFCDGSKGMPYWSLTKRHRGLIPKAVLRTLIVVWTAIQPFEFRREINYNRVLKMIITFFHRFLRLLHSPTHRSNLWTCRLIDCASGKLRDLGFNNLDYSLSLLNKSYMYLDKNVPTPIKRLKWAKWYRRQNMIHWRLRDGDLISSKYTVLVFQKK